LDVEKGQINIGLGFYDARSEDLSSVGEPTIWLIQVTIGVLYLFGEAFGLRGHKIGSAMQDLQNAFHVRLKQLPEEFLGEWAESVASLTTSYPGQVHLHTLI
jgi:hypothetical protein